ncbi:phosphotransferase [Haploplasma axanthum]|uniref:phosphotransferase n=1 Tax=Haploplasma axanthum TaxID=29552 RepID=UPI00101CEF12
MIPKYDLVIQYIKDNRHLIKNIRRVLAHTDYHLGNMIINNDDIYIIDFDKLGFEDIYSEFKPFIWNVRERFILKMVYK